MDEEDEEVIQEFLVEGREGLDQLDQELVALEDDPTNPDRLAGIFRTIHSLKGTSGFLGFSKLESISHVGENLLSNMRDGTIEFNPEVADALLKLVDSSREILENIDASGEEGDGNYDDLVKQLAQLAENQKVDKLAQIEAAASASAVSLVPAQAEAPDPMQPASPHDPAPPDATAESVDELQAASPMGEEDSGGTEDSDESQATSDGPSAPASENATAPQPEPAELSHAPPHQQGAAGASQAEAPAPERLEQAPPPKMTEDELEEAMEREMGQVSQVSKRSQASKKENSGDMTIRVDVSLLDRLMNLVGELVLSRNQILQYSSRTEDGAFLATSQRLNHITTELQEGLMKTRMQPIKSVWAKFPRVVRDLSRMCDKDVRIEMEGEDTELDRTIIEAIKDPMTHIVRNSVDHGVESPEERARRGKPKQGRLTLRAYHEGGKVNIEIADDGKGLDVKRIKDKAIEKGVATASEIARMTEREAMQLIFAPGFSTAAAVTQVSGRGVGMDVVRTNIERIGGTIDLSSRLNQGTTIKIKIPLTLAIIPALVVDCGGDSYAIPQVSLLELVRFEREQAETAVEHVHGAPVCRLRGNLMPLVYLHEVLGVAPCPQEDEAVNIVVLQADDRHFGLVVDRVSDTEEIVVKPLGKELKSVGIFAGATIMGDGHVALILDVLGVAKIGSLAAQERDRRLRHVGAADRDGNKRYTMLVFRINEQERGAVPLKAVARLEEVPRERIEVSGGDEVVQYRGEIMPIVRIAEALGRPPRPRAEVEQVLVFSRRQKSVGIIVDAIEDVVEETLDVHRPISKPGVRGQAVLQGRVTELIDLPELVAHALPGFYDVEAAE